MRTAINRARHCMNYSKLHTNVNITNSYNYLTGCTIAPF